MMLLLFNNSFFLSSDTALGQEMAIMAGFGVAHKLYIYDFFFFEFMT